MIPRPPPVHIRNKTLGEINDFCILYGIYNTLVDKINNMDELKYEFNLSIYDEIFYFLYKKLYGDTEMTITQINEDVKLYHKFNFLTNSCESFDGTHSFIFIDKNDMVNILYRINYKENKIISNKIERKTFEDITKDFIKWYEEENKRNNEVRGSCV